MEELGNWENVYKKSEQLNECQRENNSGSERLTKKN